MSNKFSIILVLHFIFIVFISYPFENKKNVSLNHINNKIINDSIIISFITDGTLPLSFGYYDDNYNYIQIRLIKGIFEKEKKYFINKEKIIIYDNSGINCPYILYAGDNINISISKKKLSIISLNKKERNIELNFFNNLLKDKEIPSIGTLQKKYANNLSKNIVYNNKINTVLEANKIDLRNYLDEYEKNNFLSESFKTDVKKLLQFTHITNLLTPIIEKPFKPFKYDDYFTKILILQKNEFIDSNNLYNHTFRFSLYQYNKFLCREFLNSSNSYDEQFKSAIKNFDGNCKNYLLYELIRTAYYSDFKVFKNYKKIFEDNCQNDYFKNYIKSLPNLDEVNTGTSELKTHKGNLISFDDLIKNNKSKITLIDFWASWCLPCINSLNKFDNFKMYFKNKSISFVFVSLDDNENIWKLYTKNFKSFMIDSNSYLLINNFNSSICKKYNISSIPRYMVFDENKNVISLNFKMDNQNEAIKQLNKWLDN